MSVHPEDVGPEFAGHGRGIRPGKKDMQPAGTPTPEKPASDDPNPDLPGDGGGPGVSPQDMQPA